MTVPSRHDHVQQRSLLNRQFQPIAANTASRPCSPRVVETWKSEKEPTDIAQRLRLPAAGVLKQGDGRAWAVVGWGAMVEPACVGAVRRHAFGFW